MLFFSHSEACLGTTCSAHKGLEGKRCTGDCTAFVSPESTRASPELWPSSGLTSAQPLIGLQPAPGWICQLQMTLYHITVWGDLCANKTNQQEKGSCSSVGGLGQQWQGADLMYIDLFLFILPHLPCWATKGECRFYQSKSLSCSLAEGCCNKNLEYSCHLFLVSSCQCLVGKGVQVSSHSASPDRYFWAETAQGKQKYLSYSCSDAARKKTKHLSWNFLKIPN